MIQQIEKRRVVLYGRVSTSEQNCERQMSDLRAFAHRCGYVVVGEFSEKKSGADSKRVQRGKIMAMAQSRDIDAVLVTELSRWGRSVADLLSTVNDLQSCGVSLIAQTGMTFDLSTASGKMMLTILAGFSEFERDLIRERVQSGLAEAKARGVTLGRRKGYRPTAKHDRIVKKHLEEGKTQRWIARELQISRATIVAMVRSMKAAGWQSPVKSGQKPLVSN